MNENEIPVKPEDCSKDDERTVANMDVFDFMEMLQESRII